MTHFSLVISFAILFFISYSNAQQCDESSHVARFDCYPENDPTKEKCIARNCCWRLPVDQPNYTEKQPTVSDLPGVPFCYYPKDFPTYEVTSNEPTDFGQRIQIVKSQTTYMPNDILDLTVDLIYETQQRFRMKIYDPANKRYEVPLDVPVVQKKADMTDYEVVVKSKPFALVVSRKSTGAIL
jgi:lysosomal alpha-glucosidase